MHADTALSATLPAMGNCHQIRTRGSLTAVNARMRTHTETVHDLTPSHAAVHRLCAG